MPPANLERDESDQIQNLHDTTETQLLRDYTRWWNSYLKPRDLEIKDLCKDITDGILPMRLLEAIEGLDMAPVKKIGSGQRMKIMGKTINAKITNPMQIGENLTAFLDIITKDKKIKLVNIGPQDLTDDPDAHPEPRIGAKPDLILGLTWELIQYYELGARSDDASKGKKGDKAGNQGIAHELLEYCKELCAHDAGLELSGDWGTAFRDGKAFCAMVHSHHPDSFDYAASASWEPEKRLDAAFKAGAEMGAPALLDAADVAAGSVDKKMLMAYVGKLKKAFRDAEERAEEAKRQEAAAAAERAKAEAEAAARAEDCLLYTSPSPRDRQKSRMPSSA